MRKTVSSILVCALLLSIFVFSAQAVSDTEIELLAKGAEWEYVVYKESSTGLTTSAPEGWLNKADSAEWTKGNAPFTCTLYTNASANTKFPFDYFNAFIRTTFNLDDASKITCLTLNVKYDENPVIYINGQQVWSATGYKDNTYTAISLYGFSDYLKNGENTVCVNFSNINGGAVFDMDLIGETSETDADGYLYAQNASSTGFVYYGNNDPSNVLDGNADTVCGSNWNSAEKQSVTVSYTDTKLIAEIYIQCKNEGIPENNEIWGTYDLYAILNGIDTKIASDVPALPDVKGGQTVKFDKPYKADAIKAVITSWNGSAWACVADLMAKPAPEGSDVSTADVDGNVILSGVSCTGFANFGTLNAPSNVLDGDQTSVCGSSYNANTVQSITVSFLDTVYLTEIFVQCKDEGTTTNDDGTRGTYDIYVVKDGAETKIAESVPAVTGTNGGYTVSLDRVAAVDAVKIVITSWQGSDWACVADVSFKAADFDLNDDKNVSIADVTTLLNAIAEDEALVCGKNADLDRKGTVDLPDVTLLLNYMEKN